MLRCVNAALTSRPSQTVARGWVGQPKMAMRLSAMAMAMGVSALAMAMGMSALAMELSAT